MAILTLKIEDSDAKVLASLADAAQLAAQVQRIDETTTKISTGADLIVSTDRTRAIDQIKRIYGVIVAFAAVTFLNCVVVCIKRIDLQNWVEAAAVLLAQGVSFFSLLIVFIFGAERLFDLRYLQPASPVPRWNELIADVLCVLFTASWFVMLANLLPTGDRQIISLAEMQNSQRAFVGGLFLIYLFDVVILSRQAKRFRSRAELLQSKGAEAKDQNDWSDVHHRWRQLNLLMLAVVIAIGAYLQFAPPEYVFYNAASIALIVLHIGRFCFDFKKNIAFYYPQGQLSTALT